MPNYKSHQFAPFKEAKRREKTGDRQKTPRKTQGTSWFTFNTSKGPCNKTFTYDHKINDEGRVYLGMCEKSCSVDAAEGAVEKLTLANDSRLDQDMAKLYLLRQLGSKFGEDSLKELIEAKLGTTRGMADAKAIVNEELEKRFDIGRGFIKGWEKSDLQSLRDKAKAFGTVFGTGRPTTANLRFVLREHDLILQTLLRQNFQSEEEVNGFVARANAQIENVNARMDHVLARLDAQGFLVNELNQRFDELGNQVDEHGRRLDGHEARITRLEGQIAEMRLGKSTGTQELRVEPPPPPVTPQVVAPKSPLDTLQKHHFDSFEHGLKTGDDMSVRVNEPHVKGRDIKTLTPGAWLNDTVINDFLKLLSHCNSGSKVYAFSNFFFPKLFEDGDFDYDKVRRWGKRVPSGNIFDLHKLYVPFNKNAVHWALIAVDFKEETITAYDSLSYPCTPFLDGMLQYLEQEYRKLEGETLPKSWSCQDTKDDPELPRQENYSDCGVFVCMYAYCLTLGKELKFDQKVIDDIGRAKIGASVLEGKVV